MSNALPALFEAFTEWRSVRKTLRSNERRSFAKWVVRAHPEIAESFRDEPARFTATCRELQRGSRGRVASPGIGPATLARYAGALQACWAALPDESRGRLGDFIARVLHEHPTPRALQRFLRAIRKLRGDR